MNKAVGAVILLAFALVLWLVGPLLSIGLNALFRPDYQLRDLATEYRARLRPNRVYWFDYKVYRMGRADGDEQRVVVLHTADFDEPPEDFLAEAYPACSGFDGQDDDRWPGLRGVLIGRW